MITLCTRGSLGGSREQEWRMWMLFVQHYSAQHSWDVQLVAPNLGCQCFLKRTSDVSLIVRRPDARRAFFSTITGCTIIEDFENAINEEITFPRMGISKLTKQSFSDGKPPSSTIPTAFVICPCPAWPCPSTQCSRTTTGIYCPAQGHSNASPHPPPPSFLGISSRWSSRSCIAPQGTKPLTT